MFVKQVIKPNIQPDGTLDLPGLREINKKAKVRFEYPLEMRHTTIQPLGVKEILDADKKEHGEEVKEDGEIASKIIENGKKPALDDDE